MTMMPLEISIAVCIASLFIVVLLLRRDRISFGLPAAYLFSLLLIHLPGAYAHAMRPEIFASTREVTVGTWQTAVASLAFCAGVYWARRNVVKLPHRPVLSTRPRFWLFCLFGGWFFIFALGPLAQIASVGAVIEKGGAIWMLGVMIALYYELYRLNLIVAFLWMVALAVYPIFVYLFSGFVSYGSTATLIVLSMLSIRTKSFPTVVIATVIVSIIGLSFYLQYITERSYLRSVLWSEAGVDPRIDVTLDVFSLPNFELPDLDNDQHAWALDLRLNQNYFVGLAARRIEQNRSDFLHGATIYDAAIALVPRVLWPDKPVYGGSGSIVADATGLRLARNTSWGAGQVMELYINFGWYSLIGGFVFLGWLIAVLDRKAAAAERRGDGATAIIFFLPAIALIQPNGSLVELSSGSAAALMAAYGWRWLWLYYSARVERIHQPAQAKQLPQ